MKKTLTYLSLFTLVITISSCGTPATPMSNSADIQSTAVSAAFTIVAQTQAAIPTSTSIPPTEAATETPVPTNTVVVLETETPQLPTLDVASTATASASTGGNGDPCNKVLQSISGGKPATIKVQNNTGAPITYSIYLNITPFGDCGFRGYTLTKGGSTIITDLIQACYNVSVLVNDPKKPTKSFGYGCINNPDKWTIVITRESATIIGK
ncbi:MAG: hypothetical protein ABI986_10885, partial [Chloroflexota bacterium]